MFTHYNIHPQIKEVFDVMIYLGYIPDIKDVLLDGDLVNFKVNKLSKNWLFGILRYKAEDNNDLDHIDLYCKWKKDKSIPISLRISPHCIDQTSKADMLLDMISFFDCIRNHPFLTYGGAFSFNKIHSSQRKSYILYFIRCNMKRIWGNVIHKIDIFTRWFSKKPF